MTTTQKTVLFAEHEKLGAKFVPFAGWDMPVQYPTGVLQEHLAVRHHAGIFDVSHMGNILLEGPESGALLDYLTTWQMSKLAPGQAKYTVFLNEQAGVIDDLIVYCLQPNMQYLIIWNASNHEKNINWVNKLSLKFNIKYEDLTQQYALIALQGLEWQNVFTKTLGNHIPEKKFTANYCPFLNTSVLVARTGYTGEDGVELWCPNSVATELWQKLLNAGAQPCGLAARDSLRIEAGLPLYGHELDDQTTPFEAGVGFVVQPTHTNFYGASLLTQKKMTTQRHIVGFRLLDRGVPRQGCEIYNHAQQKIGVVSSGTFSPICQAGIGLAFIDKTARNDFFSQHGYVDIRGKKLRLVASKLPLHKNYDTKFSVVNC